MNDIKALVLLPRLQVQNANAISGPFTWGFPAPTAFAGFAHALQRRLVGTLKKGFGGVGIVCHKFDPQVIRPAGKYSQVFQLTRNPVDKDGGSSAFVEEGRAHMEVSLLLALREAIDSDEREAFARQIMALAQGMRLAGGSLLPARAGKRFEAEYLSFSQSVEEQEEKFRKLRRRLLPGFALVQREDRLAAHLGEMTEIQQQANALDALLDLTRLNYEPDQPNLDKPGEKQWGIRKHSGWLVPVPVGYAGISRLYAAGEVRNARDDAMPFRFVETLYSLGEWVSPHRLTTWQQMLWHQGGEIEKGIYLCTNRYADFLSEVHSTNT